MAEYDLGCHQCGGPNDTTDPDSGPYACGPCARDITELQQALEEGRVSFTVPSDPQVGDVISIIIAPRQ